MRNYLLNIILIAVVFSCTNSTKPKETKIVDKGPLTEKLKDTLDFEYKEWYPGRVHLKIEGHFDENNARHGSWVSYYLDGKVWSMTTYTHGLKQGFSIVKHANGAIYYRGEYQNDLKVGLWTFHNDKGEFAKEVNYDVNE